MGWPPALWTKASVIQSGPPPRSGASATRALLLLLRADGLQHGQILRVNRVFRERLIHLVPALFRPEHFQMGAWIPLVADRIVVDAEPEDLAACRDLQRLLQLVIELPVEVELRHVENCLLGAVRIDDDPLQAL